MNLLETIYYQVIFLLSTLTWFGVLDLLLVTAVFYLVLSLIRRSTGGHLMREAIILVGTLLIITTLLPLPVFDWLVRGLLVALLITTPIIFQVPLRRFFERVGYAAGIGKSTPQTAIEYAVPQIVHAVENMASTKTGALIVLESNKFLDNIIQTGVSLGGRATSELLQSIFYSGTPLHDGAVILRGDKVVAAGCVLPLTEQNLNADKRLGTRHRAAVGMSEQTDALVIVVSEETGQISAAQFGQLDRPLDTVQLREKLFDFYNPQEQKTTRVSMWKLLKKGVGALWSPAVFKDSRQLIGNVGMLLVSLLLAMVVWSFVIQQADLIAVARVDGIPLRVEDVPPNVKLIPAPPTTVSAIIQTTRDILPTLSTSGFQATAELENTTPGLQRLSIQVESGIREVQVLTIEPAALDVEVAPVISKTMPIVIIVPEEQGLSAAYEMVREPTSNPTEVQINGPAPLVNQVDIAQTTVSLSNVNTSIRETRPVKALDAEGQEVTGVTIVPNQAQLSIIVRQKLNASDASVKSSIIGTPPEGYQLQTVSANPNTVTLQGSSQRLAEAGSVVNTLPVDISRVTSELIVQTPLDLPENVKAVDSTGDAANTVTVTVRVAPLSGNLSATRSVEVINTLPAITKTAVTPTVVDLLLTGSIPVLDEIETDPGLLRVVVDASDLTAGQSASFTPQVIAPPGVQAQVVPPSVTVLVE